MSLSLSAADWLNLFVHFLTLSLLSVGGAISTAPEMHRYLVDEQHWLSDSQFMSSIALAQAAPGPNVLYVALIGWNVGLNAGAGAGLATGLPAGVFAILGVVVSMVGMLLPSTTLTFAVTRWGHQNRELRAVRAFKQGLAPIVIGLLVAAGWVMVAGHGSSPRYWPLWLLTAVSTLIVWRTKLPLLWLLGAGGLLGWLGLV